jgi:hypothetical protein
MSITPNFILKMIQSRALKALEIAQWGLVANF